MYKFNGTNGQLDLSGSNSGGSIPGIIRLAGTFDISAPLVAEYPKADFTTAVNAVQTGNGTGVGPTIQNGDSWRIIGGGGYVGPNSKLTKDGNFLVAIVNGATNSDADWVILETDEEYDEITRAEALALITASTVQSGTMYKITDRLGIILLGMNSNSFSYEGTMLIPSGTGALMADEQAIVHYDIVSDNIFYVKDIRNNEYKNIFLSFGTLLTSLDGVYYGYANMDRNIFGGDSLPVVDNTFTGVITKVVSYGSLNAIGAGTLDQVTVDSGGTLSITTGNSLTNGHISSNGSVTLSGDGTITNLEVHSGGTLIYTSTGTNEFVTIGEGGILNHDANANVRRTRIGNLATCTINSTGELVGCVVEASAVFDDGLSHNIETIEPGRSTFEITIDISGLTTIDFTTLGIEPYGIIGLTSANPTETINLFVGANTNHPFEFRPETGLEVTFDHGTGAGQPRCEGGVDSIIDGTTGDRTSFMSIGGESFEQSQVTY